MTHIEKTVIIHKPGRVVFDFVGDYRNIPKYTDIIKNVQPTTTGEISMGARFLAEGKVGMIPLAAELEVTDFEAGKSFTMKTISGPTGVISWSLQPVPEGTKAVAVMDFELPKSFMGVVVGKTLGKWVDNIADKSIEEGLNKIRGILESD